MVLLVLGLLSTHELERLGESLLSVDSILPLIVALLVLYNSVLFDILCDLIDRGQI